MNIRDFYRSNSKTCDQTNNNHTYENNSNNTSTAPSQDFSEYQSTIDKYKDLSQQDLYKELFTQASQLKSQGKLDDNTLNTLSNTLAPMLNDEQRELLNNLISRLK